MMKKLGLALALYVFLSAPTAAAQPTSEPPSTDDVANARAAMERGIRAFEAGSMEAALAEFERAKSLVPSANLPWRYSGDALTRLGRHAEAVESYERYLTLRPNVSDADEVREKVAEIRRRHLEGALLVSCTPAGAPGAAVFLDDGSSAVGVTPATIPAVRVGPHRVVVRAEGYAEWRGEANVTGGATTTITCTLVAETPARTEPPRGEKPRDDGMPRRTIGWITAGSGLAIFGTAALLDVTWLRGKVDDFHASAESGDGNAERLSREANTLQTGVLVTYCIGAAALIGGLVLVLTDRR
jgi:tetratricopeptide (TPR) repeat protein